MTIQSKAEGLKNYIDYICKRNKARDVFKEFMSIFDGQVKNNDVENTIVYKALVQLLSSNKSEFCKNLNKGDIFYRARIVNNKEHDSLNSVGIHVLNDGSITGFDEANSKEPPLGISSDGRNNYKGASYLYLSETPMTAIAEVNPQSTDLVSVAKFAVKKQMKIVDFNNDACVSRLKKFETENGISASLLITMIMQQYCTPVSNAKEYAATQYISDLIRKMGYDGIKYRSSKTEEANVTIFTCYKNYIAYVESKLFFFHMNTPIAYEINSGKKICYEANDIDKADIDKLRRDLKILLKSNEH